MRDFKVYRELLAHLAWQSAAKPASESVAAWLLHTDSLTEKLQGVCASLQVEVINEGWQAVNSHENTAKQWVREVVLKCGDRDWIFAQTVLPEATVQNVAADVLSLGEQPIGLWLFPQRPERLSLEWQQDPQTGLFARRSLLQLKSYPIEIKELFLPYFPFE